MVPGDDDFCNCLEDHSPPDGQIVHANGDLRPPIATINGFDNGPSLLLRDSDHRIKNSLQLVASLLNVQASRETHAGARSALIAAATRVHAVAGVHDALQKNPGLGLVNIGDAVRTLCVALHQMAGDAETVSVSVDAHTVLAPAELARPIMIIVNELVINSLRHAFAEKQRGAVCVSVIADGRALRVIVTDNGRGLPADRAGRKGYGTTLIKLIADQIGGTLSYDSVAGARTELSVRLPQRAAVEIVA